MTRIPRESLVWARSHLKKYGDTDLFPRPFELDHLGRAVKYLEDVDLPDYDWSAARYLLVPKSDLSFRRACQLDPVDALMLAGVMHHIGAGLESKRSPKSERAVFSYRFDPTLTFELYGENNGWKDFWTTSLIHSRNHSFVLITDIVDFYNQIYHHVIEQVLDQSGVHRDVSKAIIRLLSSLTTGVSRGIPTGPNSTHLLAEASLIPLDNYLQTMSRPYCRYVDDIHIFCDSENDAKVAAYQVASFLDSSSKMLLNDAKTTILASSDFSIKAESMIAENPISDDEAKLVQIIGSGESGPYGQISLDDLSVEELDQLDDIDLEKIISEYLSMSPINYARIRWMYRRLAQLGDPRCVRFTLEHIAELTPALRDVSSYLASAEDLYEDDWSSLSSMILAFMNHPIVNQSEYLQLALISLYGRIPALDHIAELVRMYQQCSPGGRRKVILAAKAANASSWLQSLKVGYSNMDPWQRRALLAGASTFSSEERGHWFGLLKRNATPLELAIMQDIHKT